MEVAGGGKQGLNFGASGEGIHGVSVGVFGASPAPWNAAILESLSHQKLTLIFLASTASYSAVSPPETRGTLIWGFLG